MSILPVGKPCVRLLLAGLVALLGLVTSRNRGDYPTLGNQRGDLLILCKGSREAAINHPVNQGPVV